MCIYREGKEIVGIVGKANVDARMQGEGVRKTGEEWVTRATNGNPGE